MAQRACTGHLRADNTSLRITTSDLANQLLSSGRKTRFLAPSRQLRGISARGRSVPRRPARAQILATEHWSSACDARHDMERDLQPGPASSLTPFSRQPWSHPSLVAQGTGFRGRRFRVFRFVGASDRASCRPEYYIRLIEADVEARLARRGMNRFCVLGLSTARCHRTSASPRFAGQSLTMTGLALPPDMAKIGIPVDIVHGGTCHRRWQRIGGERCWQRQKPLDPDRLKGFRALTESFNVLYSRRASGFRRGSRRLVLCDFDTFRHGRSLCLGEWSLRRLVHTLFAGQKRREFPVLFCAQPCAPLRHRATPRHHVPLDRLGRPARSQR